MKMHLLNYVYTPCVISPGKQCCKIFTRYDALMSCVRCEVMKDYL